MSNVCLQANSMLAQLIVEVVVALNVCSGVSKGLPFLNCWMCASVYLV